MEVEPQVESGARLVAKRGDAAAGSRRALPRISPDIVVRKLLRRLWSTRRAIAVVRNLGGHGETPAGLQVEFVPADGFDALPRLVEQAVGIEYLYVRPIERTRQARAGTISVARDPDGELMAFHFVHSADDHKALNQVAPNMYPPMQSDEVLTEAVYCLPAFRGRAIAPQLLVATGTNLAARGMRRAWAYLDTTNVAALRMFNRAGYAPAGTERVDRYRFGRFSTEFRDLTPTTAREWDVGIAGSRERAT
jgi:GNAT superfamily N-acetyltransferase